MLSQFMKENKFGHQ